MSRKFLVVLVLGFTLFLTGCNRNKQEVKPTPTPAAQFSDIKILKPGEGPSVDLVPRADKKAVTLKIEEITSDIKKIEYELVYDTDGVQRGVLGTLDHKGKTEISKEILLASCSKNVCVFDKNVENLFLTVKFSGEKETAQFQKEYSL